MDRSYVNFVANTHNTESTGASLPANATLHDKVIAALRSIYDPEIPVNLYDLGLIYKIDIQGQDVAIDMTLTTPHCPVAESMPGQVECALREIDGIGKVSVRLTWDPPWTMDKLSDEVKLSLGIL
jgi:FeS assembly SUF system protein